MRFEGMQSLCRFCTGLDQSLRGQRTGASGKEKAFCQKACAWRKRGYRNAGGRAKSQGHEQASKIECHEL
jgi:hypothetical protein